MSEDTALDARVLVVMGVSGSIGHVTVIGDDLDDVTYRARSAAAHFDD